MSAPDFVLEDRVRDLIGARGPQLPVYEYNKRIEEELDRMSCADLLYWISLALEEEGGL